MESRDNRFEVRLTRKEREKLAAICDGSGLNASQVVRAFIAIGNDVNEGKVVVFDRDTAPKIAREMRKWGYHYNQAVHALNRIAYYAERGSLRADDAHQLLQKACANLEDVRAGSEALAKEVASLMEYELVRI